MARILNSFDSDLEKALRLADPTERQIWVNEARFAICANFMASLAGIYEREALDIIEAKILEFYPHENSVAYTADLEAIEADLRRLGKLRAYDKRIPVAVPSANLSPAPPELTEEEKLMAQVREDLGFFEIPDDPEEAAKLGLQHMTAGLSTVEIEQKCSNPAYRRAYQKVRAEAIAGGYGQSLTPKAAPAVDPAVQQFAHMLNEHFRDYGSPRMAAGKVTLKVGDKRYDYPVATFDKLSEQAAVAGLL